MMAYKIASADMTNLQLIDKMQKTETTYLLYWDVPEDEIIQLIDFWTGKTLNTYYIATVHILRRFRILI